ncbi:MAG: hypothetical protein ACP6IP_10900 [Candidatus Njordarchaeia archaeon]
MYNMEFDEGGAVTGRYENSNISRKPLFNWGAIRDLDRFKEVYDWMNRLIEIDRELLRTLRSHGKENVLIELKILAFESIVYLYFKRGIPVKRVKISCYEPSENDYGEPEYYIEIAVSNLPLKSLLALWDQLLFYLRERLGEYAIKKYGIFLSKG